MTNPSNERAPNDFHDPLLELAKQYGIESEFWDIWGARHVPTSEAQLAILRSLGIAADSEQAINDALTTKYQHDWTRPLPPTVVVSGEATLSIPVRLAQNQLRQTVRADVETELGEKHSLVLEPQEWAEIGRMDLDGQTFLELKGEWPLLLAAGYHHLQLGIGSNPPTYTRLIVTPGKAWLPDSLRSGSKTAGVALSLYGIRSQRNWGCGDTSDLLPLLEWLRHDIGGSFLALNPLHAIENRQPYNTSPYLPNSAFWRNPLYLDIENVAEFQTSKATGLFVNSPATQSKLRQLRESEFVEYEQVWELKKQALRLLFREFLSQRRRDPNNARWLGFQRFISRNGERLSKFALYCALWDWLHRRDRQMWIWPDWPERYRDPASAAVTEFAQRNPIRILFHMYVQWLLDEQLAAVQESAHQLGLPIGLYHDLALAVDKCGADLWAYREFFVAGCRVGSPPDGFAPEGQDWAFPPPNALKHREEGYQLFIDAIRANSRHGGALRIDHVMRLFRLYWIPDGLKAHQGAYVQDFYEDLLGILALESHRGQFLIVGEDLGTVSDKVREALDRYGILSYKVLYFEKGPSGELRKAGDYQRQALVSSTTHDLPTLAGFWINRDIEARRQAGLLADDASFYRQLTERAHDKQLLLNAMHEQQLLPTWFPRQAHQIPELTGELHNAIIGFLASTPAMLLALNQEDLTKEIDQQNLPASTWQYPNWRRKMKFSIEELRSLPTARDFAAMFRHWLDQSGRSIHRFVSPESKSSPT